MSVWDACCLFGMHVVCDTMQRLGHCTALSASIIVFHDYMQAIHPAQWQGHAKWGLVGKCRAGSSLKGYFIGLQKNMRCVLCAGEIF